MTMKTLISPAEVLTIAFGTTHTLRESDVPEHTILATERKFLLPVLGVDFFDKLVGEEQRKVYMDKLLENETCGMLQWIGIGTFKNTTLFIFVIITLLFIHFTCLYGTKNALKSQEIVPKSINKYH